MRYATSLTRGLRDSGLYAVLQIHQLEISFSFSISFFFDVISRLNMLLTRLTTSSKTTKTDFLANQISYDATKSIANKQDSF